MPIRVLAVLNLLTATLALAQSRPAPGLEPGEAEGRVKSRTVDRDIAFTHPAAESRGVWVASNDLLGPRDVMLRKLDQLKAAHFNTVLIDCWFRGHTAYPGSAIAPLYPDFKGEDAFGSALDEAKRRGLRAQAWVSYGFYAYFTPDASKDQSMGAILDKHPELVSIDDKGAKVIHRSFGDYYSLCPANPRSHEILGQLMVEVVKKYPELDGVHLDRIRFAEAEFCHCDYCKAHFKGERKPDSRPWLEWKRQQTLAAVKHFERVIHAARPGLPITSYVVGPDEMDARGQSWDLWANQGVLDAVAVSMYGADIRPAAKKALGRLGPEGRSRLICAISADGIPTDVYAANVQAARTFSPLGQFTWFLGKLDDADFAALTAGPYAKPAKNPIEPKP